MEYLAARKALEERQETRIELGLSRVRRHLKRLGDPHAGLAVLHVAGTNGKGSVCAMLDSVLRAAGYRVGLYTSPHLFDVRERVKVDGRWIPEKDFGRLMGRALRADKERTLTYFELLTSVAFQWFSEREVDAAVLETGLGGRLDATNVVERPLASIITSLSMDHMSFLGETLPEIAAEKAGIIKRGCPVFCGSLSPAALNVVTAKARAAGSALTVSRLPWRSVKVDWPRNEQVLEDFHGRRWRLHLLGAGQGANAALARSVLDGLFGVLPVEEKAWERGLAQLAWPARFAARRLGRKTVILDGAHNPEAMRNLAETWRRSPWAGRRARWIMGVMRDKDVDGIIKPVAPYLREVVTVRPPSPRALEPVTLARAVRRLAPAARVTVERDPQTALRSWLEGPGPGVALVCGSFYLVGAAGGIIHDIQASS
ncbi:MAG: bifunctional folylpolyglutamate synthase/dihydrofolate synthase [Elusimicrobia bacterium]|nr:bifunctional folylpolyglutamate synthase/dihydrofolate synthase [Elusimicrobiota bacterium]